MSEEQKESPPAGGADGQGNSQKPQAVDNTENKPNGAGEQEDFSGSAARRYPDYVKSFARADADRIFNLSALQPLKDRANWVLWRWEWNEKNGKWDKPPFQVADPTKGAANNRSSNWARFEDALSAAVQSQILGGVGFCLTSGLVCFDLDRCRNAVTGEVAQWARGLIETCSRSITERTNIWTGERIIEAEGCYVEVTPSLTGLRIWGYGRDRKIKYKRIPMPGEGVLEVFRGTNRYLTVTGAIFENCNGAFKNLDNVIDQYQAAEAARQAPKGVPAASGTRAKGQSSKERPWSPAAEAELRGALSMLDADDRGNWFRFGGAIHDLHWENDERDIGREIWDDWSGISPKFDSFDQDKTWEGFQNRDWDDGNTTVASIYHEARARGWRPPGQKPLTVAEIEADDCATTITPAQTPPSSEPSPDEEAPSEPKEIPQNPLQLPQGIEWGNFYAHAEQGNYWFLPTGKLWPAKSVNARLPWIPIVDAEGQPVLYTRGPKEGEPKMMAPSAWLDRNQAVQSLTWSPGLPPIIQNYHFKEGGWIEAPGCNTLNLYRPPNINIGNANIQEVGLYTEHWAWLYPGDWEHLLAWQAWKVQHPEEKINHCLLVGGVPGIGKDTALAPLRYAVGVWNWADVSPKEVLERWTHFRRSVICRVSEAHDLGEKDRFDLYETLKTLATAPPELITVDEKRICQYYVPNVVGLIITSNYRQDAIYLPANDRRTYVAWSDIPEYGLSKEKGDALWNYYKSGGFIDICAYLRQYNLAQFDPYAAPKKTEAFWSIVNAHRSHEESSLADALDKLGRPLAITLDSVLDVLGGDDDIKLREWFRDPRNNKAVLYRFDGCGYLPHRNKAAKDNQWRIHGKRQTVYVQKELDVAGAEKAVEALRDVPQNLASARFREMATRLAAERAKMELEKAEKVAVLEAAEKAKAAQANVVSIKPEPDRNKAFWDAAAKVDENPFKAWDKITASMMDPKKPS